MNIKKIIISFFAIIGFLAVCFLAFIAIGEDFFEDIGDLFFSRGDKVVTVTNGKKEVFTKLNGKYIKQDASSQNVNPNVNINNDSSDNVKTVRNGFFGPKVKVTKSKAKAMQFQNYDNGLFSMKIPQGWTVGVANTDYVHYSFMVYDPKNPQFKMFFNMKTEGYLKTQQMKNLYMRSYPSAPMAKLPVISPQTTEAFYSVFTQAFLLEQSRFPFKIPVIKNFKAVQPLGRNQTGGSIVRATFINEFGKPAEGVFTATIKEFAMPPVVMLIVYNAVFFSAPQGELVDWLPVLNYSLSTVRFSNTFTNGYYSQQGQIVKNASALQSILNQTSNIITSGWNERQKTYDILSQKRSDATMGYDRVRDTETGDIYKAELGFMDHDWNGRYEHITDDMYTLPTSGYIEKD